MNNKSLTQLLLAAIACMVFVTGSTLAQQPFESLPDTEKPAEDAGGNQINDAPVIVRPQEDRTPLRPFETPDDEEQPADQTVLLNTEFAGWQEANSAAGQDRLGQDLRANWIMVDRNGRFEGRVVAGEGADIAGMNVFLMNMGRMVKETSVNREGRFQFTNVRQGAYAIVGWGSKGFFAYGLNILADKKSAGRSMPRTLTVTAFQNATTINTDWIQFFAPRVTYRVYGRYPAEQGQDDPAALYGFEGLGRFQPKAAPATSISGHRVSKSSDGRMVGRVHQFNSLSGRPVGVRSTKVMLLKGDEVIASTDTDNYGVFDFQGVEDGQYGLLAVGVDGMGLIGINVGTSAPMNDMGEMNNEQADVFDFCMVSSETIGWLNHYASEVAYRRNLLAPRRPDPSEQQYCESCGGTGCQTCGGTGLCKSRYQSFEDWAQRCCNQHEKTKLGSGYILSEFAKDLRNGTQRVEDTFDRAFYGEAYSDNAGGFNNGSGGFNNGSGGYNNGSGGYNNGAGGYNNGQYNPNAYPQPGYGY